MDLRAIELDVLSQESADTAIKTIISENGHLDVVIHNAGHMVFGPAEAFTPEQLAQSYDINVLSTAARKPRRPSSFSSARKGPGRLGL